MKVLLTGGAGYIGTHTAIEFISQGHEVIIVDNLYNSSEKAIDRVESLTQSKVTFYKADLMDISALSNIFATHQLDAVVHFAGLKAVGESVINPLQYYRINLMTSMNLLFAMAQYGVSNLVFSSSATVYGEPEQIPIDESCSVTKATSPYGQSKLIIERIIADHCHANPEFNAARLRYFNPGGAHESGEIGEDPKGIPNNLLPFITQVAVGKREKLVIFGNDYPTQDGTCVRDYIHVVDLAKGHIAAVTKLMENPGLVTYNLGTGSGYSVTDIVNAFQTANQLTIPVETGPRRAGDIPVSYTDPTLAWTELNWKAEKGIEEICKDAWRWQQKNPNGYE